MKRGVYRNAAPVSTSYQLNRRTNLHSRAILKVKVAKMVQKNVTVELICGKDMVRAKLEVIT
jgi:hypothetical protein